MSFPEIVNTCLLRQRMIFVVTLLVAFAAVAGTTFSLPKVYQATTTILVGQTGAGAGEAAPDIDDLESLTRTYAELLKSASIAQAVARRLSFRAAVGDLQDVTSAEVIAGTRLLRISAEDRVPRRAQAIANAYGQTLIDEQRRRAGAGTDRAREELGKRIGDLVERSRALEGSGSVRSEAELRAVRSELEAAVTAYRSLELEAAQRGSDVSIASPATVPGSPVRPRPSLYLAGGLILSLLLALAAALLRDSLDKRIRDEDEISRIAGAPVLARIPRARTPTAVGVWDAYQLLRSNIQLTDPRGALRVLTVVSSDHGEGKSTVVSHLSAAFGLVGAQVIAVDCDLRRPRLHTFLRGKTITGVSTVLMNRGGDDIPLQETGARNVRLLACGPIPPDPPVLLSSERFPRLLREVQEKADYVILDTPPVNVGADASIVAAAGDAVLLVVDFRAAKREALQATRAQLEKSGSRIVGVLINRAPPTPDVYGPYYQAPRPGLRGRLPSRPARPAKTS